MKTIWSLQDREWSLFSNLYIDSDQSIIYLVNDNLSEDEPRKKTHVKSDAEELKEVAEALPELFGAINDAIPKLISGLIESVYSIFNFLKCLKFFILYLFKLLFYILIRYFFK